MSQFERSVSVPDTYRKVHHDLLVSGQKRLGVSLETIDQIDWNLYLHVNAHFDAPCWAQRNEGDLHQVCGRLVLRENPRCTYPELLGFLAEGMRFHTMQRIGFSCDLPALGDFAPWPWATHPTYRALLWPTESMGAEDPEKTELPVGMYRVWVCEGDFDETENEFFLRLTVRFSEEKYTIDYHRSLAHRLLLEQDLFYLGIDPKSMRDPNGALSDRVLEDLQTGDVRLWVSQPPQL